MSRVRIARISRLHAGSARFGWQLGMHGQLGTVCVPVQYQTFGVLGVQSFVWVCRLPRP